MTDADNDVVKKLLNDNKKEEGLIWDDPLGGNANNYGNNNNNFNNNNNNNANTYGYNSPNNNYGQSNY